MRGTGAKRQSCPDRGASALSIGRRVGGTRARPTQGSARDSDRAWPPALSVSSYEVRLGRREQVPCPASECVLLPPAKNPSAIPLCSVSFHFFGPSCGARVGPLSPTQWLPLSVSRVAWTQSDAAGAYERPPMTYAVS